MKFRRRLGLEELENRINPVAIPTATFGGLPADPLIGESASFSVRFDNTSPSDPGFGPYVDLYLPATGVDGAGAAIDDGLSFVSATYLGSPLRATVVTLTAAGVPHPFAKGTNGQPLIITPPAGFREGDQLVVLELPFGSFTADQPPADIQVTTTVSSLADVGTALPLRAVGGFRFGNDSLDNPATDPTINGVASTATVTPSLLRLTKTYIGPEDETATGPNFIRQYRVSVDVADGQSLTNLDLTDLLPSSLQFVSLISTSPGGATTTVSPSLVTPGGTLTVRFPTITGTAATSDAEMVFSYYVPYDVTGTPVIDPSTGDDVTLVDDASAQTNWTPQDPRDTPTLVTSDVTPVDHTLTAKSITTQKRVVVINDTGATGPTSGDTVEYTIDFQISDYFAFQNLILTDLLGDGLLLVPGSATLQVSDGHGTGGTTTGAFGAANVVVTPLVAGNQIDFNVSNELNDRAFSTNGRLVGGAIPNGGTVVGPPMSAPPLPFGPTQGRIVFQAIIQNQFSAPVPSGNPDIVSGDVLSNNISIAGDLLNVTDLTPNGQNESDTSSAPVTIVPAAFTKSVYAINGIVAGNPNAGYPSSVLVTPNDTVTYRLRLTLPAGTAEPIQIADFLPLPIFDVDTGGRITAFDFVTGAAAPVAGRAKFGPNDTANTSLPGSPVITIDSVSNRVNFDFPAFASPTRQPLELDLLFTVTVGADPFADQLLLTNQAQLSTINSANSPIIAQAITQVTSSEPVLSIKKGVVTTDNSNGVFTPSAVAPVPFNAPGTLGSRFTGTITTAGLTTTPIDSNLRDVDAGDLVTFAIVVQNTGSSTHGAFNVLIQDNLPSGFLVPGIGTQGINLRVTNGIGTQLPFQIVGSGFFGQNNGIRLIDPSATQGAIGPAATDGSNVVIITYDLRVADTVNVLETITNIGEVENYAGSPGGPDFTGTGNLADPAVVVIANNSLLTKQLVSTEIVNATNSNTEAVIGEFITYRVTLTVPEANMPGAVLTDILDPELAFVALDSAVLSSGVSITGSTTPTVTNSGRNLRFDFGTISNSNRDNSVVETITLTYRAIVVNTAASTANDRVNNAARFTFTGLGSARTASAANVTVIEPQVRIDKSVTVDGAGSIGDAGDPFVYTVTLRNPPGSNQFTADAFDLTFRDLLQSGLPGSPLSVTGFTVTDTSGLVTAANFQLATDVGTGQQVLQTVPGTSFDLPVSAIRTITIRVTGTLALAVTPGQLIPNDAEVRWTSLDGSPGQRSTFTPNSTERTGEGGPNDPNNYRATDDADINVRSVAVSKTIIATSENATIDPNHVVVGEIVRYRILVTIPEFGTPTNFQFVDLLPAGMQLLNDNAFVALVSDVGDNLVSTTLTDPLPAVPPDLYLIGDENNVASLVPQFPIPANVLSFATVNGRSQVTFDLGNVTNPPVANENDLEYAIAEFNVLILNAASNQSRTELINQVSTVQNGTTTSTVFSPPVRVAEPAIRAEKTVVSLADPSVPESKRYDAGDRVRYRVNYSNDTGPDVSTAYDVQLLDVLPVAKATLDPASILVFRNGTQIASGFTILPGANTINVTVDEVAPGEAITVIYETILTSAVEAGETISNRADLTWTSLPGPNGTLVNPTGSSNTGVSGDPTGERNGDGRPTNDYLVNDNAQIEILSPEFTKSLVDTSSGSTTANQFDTSLTDLAIGETALYQFTITLPEGTTNLVFNEQLPFGVNGVLGPIAFVFIPGIIDSFPIPSVVPTLIDSDGDGISDRVTINFGTLVNTPDGLLNNRDRLIFGLLAQVLDVPQNVDGKTLTNQASIDWGNGTITDSVTTEIVEPRLNVIKSVVAVNGTAVNDVLSPPQVDAGDLVTYRVTVRHEPASHAFASTLVLTDILPGGLQLIAGSQTIVLAPDYSSISVASPTFLVNGNTLTFSADFLDHPTSPLAPGTLDELVIEYQARVTIAALPSQTITNTQNLTYRSAPASAQTIYNNFSRPYTDSDPAAVVLNTNSISGVIYRDLNNNGIYEPGTESLITDSIDLVLSGNDNLGNPVTQNLNSTTGSYLFSGLRPGTYSIRQVNQPAGLLDGRDTPGTSSPGIAFGGTGTISTDARAPRDVETISNIVIGTGGNKSGVNYNFGEIPPGSLGNFVWEDINGNGRFDTGEMGVDGASVVLTGTDDTGAAVNRNTATAGSGVYQFNNLRPGNYQLQFTPPNGYLITVQDSAVATDATDSDPNPVTGLTSSFALGVGQSDETRDAGLYRPITVGDFVWYDLDGDGVFDVGEPGIAGVVVTLIGAGPDNSFGTADDVSFGTQTTDINGLYTFTNVAPGLLRARTSNLPAGLTIPTYDLDGIATANQAIFTGVSGINRTDVDFGYRASGSIGDLVWYDLNGDGSSVGEPGIAGVSLTITWFGRDGIEGTADDVAQTTVTDLQGNYLVNNLPLGEFRVTLDPNTLPQTPNGVAILPAPLATFDLDGVATLNTTRVTLTPARPSELGADFGYFFLPVFGDRVYLDTNGNAIQDPGEPGLGAVMLRATWAGNDGAFGTGDEFVFTRTTGSQGVYLFAGIPPGNYEVEVIGGLPTGVTNTADPDGITDSLTRFTLGGNELRLDIDFGYQGTTSVAGFVYRDFSIDGIRQPVAMQPETGIAGVTVTLLGTLNTGAAITITRVTGADGSYSFTGLPAGNYRLTETQPATVFVAGQAGFYDGLDTVGTVNSLTRGISPGKNQLQVSLGVGESGVEYNFGENPPADPFGFVYVDLNDNGIRDAGEPGIPGVAITVSGIAFAGSPLARQLVAGDIPFGSLTVFTDANGRWEFPVIPPGTFTFVEAQPFGFFDGREQNADANPPATVIVGNDRFDNVVLSPFIVRGPFNFGELRPSSISGTVYHDRNRNGTRDIDEPGIPGVPVTLTGIDNRGVTINLSVLTDAAGNYFFGSLLPGLYSLTETQPADFRQGTNAIGSSGGNELAIDVIGNIRLGVGVDAVQYLFGEISARPATLPPITGGIAPVPSKRDLLASSTPTVPFGARIEPNYVALGSVRPSGASVFLATVQSNGLVRVFDMTGGQERFRFLPFPGFGGAIQAAVADITGDEIPDIIVGAGSGGGPHIKVYDGNSGVEIRSFFAFEAAFLGGVVVTAADFNNDGRADIAVGAGPTGGPRVKVFSGGDPNSVLADFWGIEDLSVRGGLQLASGDLNGDGFADLVVGVGGSGAPRVAGFDGRSIAQDHKPSHLFSDFFAFDPSFGFGVNLTIGDVTGDGLGDLMIGAGPGGGPHLKTFSGNDLVLNRSDAPIVNTMIRALNDTGGVRLVAKDFNGDGISELVTGAANSPLAKIFDLQRGLLMDEFYADLTGTFGGIFVG
jgi:fimbrial isopeptide formation D2 family protein/uncharacterized repeat protein (TIGR01451 family)